MDYCIIDNNDSFVYNLCAYFQDLGHKISVKNIEEVSFEELIVLLEKVKGIVLSPGPGKPEDALLNQKIIQNFGEKKPILGVCLGHQTIGLNFGATIAKGLQPVHGKTSKIIHSEERLFKGLPNHFRATRYHSLVIKKETLPDTFVIDAVSEDDQIMAISHKKLPIYGVQFHPEAFLTEHGYQLLDNFNTICNDWKG